MIQAGVFLLATDLLKGTFFESATIFIAQCNAKGATGFIVNQPFGRSLHELEAYRYVGFFPLYKGGPVGEEHLYMLHRKPQNIKGSELVAQDIYLGGDFDQVAAGIRQKKLKAADIKIFVGYCGWDAGELEAEISEGSWILAQSDTGMLFS